MADKNEIIESEQPQVANLSQVNAEMVKAELVRMHQSAAQTIQSEDVELSQSAGANVTATNVTTRQSALDLCRRRRLPRRGVGWRLPGLRQCPLMGRQAWS